MEEYSDFYNLLGHNFNIEAVCPDYLPESQRVFTWYRDERGVAIISGYDPENDLSTDWLCDCGHYETSGFHCSQCGAEPLWGCDCGEHDGYDADLDFGLHHSEYDIDFDDWDDEPDFSYHPEDDGLDDWENKYG